MKFDPGFDEPLLALWQPAPDHFKRLDAIDRHFVLIVSMEMRQVMRRLSLGEHADDDSEKPR